METFDLDLIYLYAPLLAKGALMSIEILLLASILSLTLGTFFGVITSSQLRRWPFAHIVESVTFILRAVPFYVQLLIVYFVIPDLLGIHLDSFAASILALGLCSAGY